MDELFEYIKSTYGEHYAKETIQSTEVIIDSGHGTGFCVGNIQKYAKRYGKKGDTSLEWRKDIIKILHYGILQLYCHDREHNIKNEEK